MPEPALTVNRLQAWRGSAHVLQDFDLDFLGGRLAIIGRNGMGKSTVCEAVTGVLGATPGGRTVGQIHVHGRGVTDRPAHAVARLGVGYVPQGRRLFASLSVEEHLRVAARRGDWTVDRVFQLFPRLAERRKTGGTALSGGEQQMLAIGRALVTQPRLLIMDEPSEGLAPIIVEHLIEACHMLASNGMDILVVEQNLAVAAAMADELVVVANGRVAARLASADLIGDAELQRRYLGIDSHAAAT